VNQLYWRERPTYDRLTSAAERVRGEHRKLLAGKSADIQNAEKAHREAIRASVDTIRGLLQASGQVSSPATLLAVQETLEALPADERPGRLTKPLKPRGFEALSGVAIKPALRIVHGPTANPRLTAEQATGEDRGKEDRVNQRRLAKQRETEERKRKERQQQAEKELKAAEAAMLEAEDAVKYAEKALADVRAKRDEAVSHYQRARLRARE
jgi:hypothetical protein